MKKIFLSAILLTVFLPCFCWAQTAWYQDYLDKNSNKNSLSLGTPTTKKSTPNSAPATATKDAQYNLDAIKNDDPRLQYAAELMKVDGLKRQSEEKSRRFWHYLDWLGGDFNRIWLETDGRDVLWYNADATSNATFSNFRSTTEMKPQTFALNGTSFSVLHEALQQDNQVQTVQSLNLRGGNVGADQIRELQKISSSFTHLSDLFLGKNNLGDDGVKELINFLIPHLTRLETLDLEGNNLTAKSMQELIKILPRMPRLRALYLGDNNLGDDGINELAKVMPTLKLLKILSVNSNKIGSYGAKYLTISLSYLMEIQIVDLRNNNLGDAQIVDLVQVIPNMKNLLYLDLESNNFSANARQDLMKASARIAKFREMIF